MMVWTRDQAQKLVEDLGTLIEGLGDHYPPKVRQALLQARAEAWWDMINSEPTEKTELFHLGALPCSRCGATQEEIAAARKTGDAKFYAACGCDYHGDHMGCRKDCRNLGCTAKLRSERDIVCDHSA